MVTFPSQRCDFSIFSFVQSSLELFPLVTASSPLPELKHR